MEENVPNNTPNGTVDGANTSHPLPAKTPSTPTPEELAQRRKIIITSTVVILGILGFVGISIFWLYQPTTPTDKIRDIFIIFMAVESLLIGLALVILIVQLAQLINLLQNEIKPILNSTNETVNTLRGTAVFLSDNLAEPVMKINEFLAAFTQLREILGFSKRK